MTHLLLVPRRDRGVQGQHARARVHPAIDTAVGRELRILCQHRGLRARRRGATDVGVVGHQRLLGGRIVTDPRAVDLQRGGQFESARLGAPPVVVALVVPFRRREVLDDVGSTDHCVRSVVPLVLERDRVDILPDLLGQRDDGLRGGASQVGQDEERIRRVQRDFDRAIVHRNG